MVQAWGWVAWSHWRRVLGGVGGAEALDRVPEVGLPCRLRHDGLRGGLVEVGVGAGADVLEGVHHVHPFSPSRSPGPLHQAAELLQGGGRPPGEVGGGLGGGEFELEVLEWGEEDVDIRRWRAWWRLGERERRWPGLGVEDGYGRRGEREARSGPCGGGLEDMGRRWCAWRRLGERERLERGPGWSWWRLGERERRKWVVEAWWRCGERERRGWVCRAEGSGSAAVCGTGPRRSSRASQEVLAGPWGPRAAPPGTEGRQESPPPSIDPPRRGAAAAAAGGTGRVTVPGGVGPGRPFGVDVVAGGTPMVLRGVVRP